MEQKKVDSTDSTDNINNLEDSYLEKILSKPLFQRMDRSEINFINQKIKNMESEEFEGIGSKLIDLYHSRSYCISREIDYCSLKELSIPETKEEVIADAYRMHHAFKKRNNY